MTTEQTKRKGESMNEYTYKQLQQLIAEMDAGAVEDLACEVYNCRHALVDADGDVWIEGPQAGHYLHCDDLARLIGSVVVGEATS